MSRRLRRSDSGLIAGVCAGLAEYVGWTPGRMRALFLVSCLLPGPQFVAYLILWVVLPRADERR